MKQTLGAIRQADRDFGMIRDGDTVAIGVSGGKDSLVLLYALSLYRMFSPADFKLIAITVKMGFNGEDYSYVRKLAEKLNVPYYLKETEIKRIVFDVKKERSPCSLCAKLRKGALVSEAVLHSANKLALAHHREDVLSTFLLSLLFEGRISTLAPFLYLDRSKITQIRPLVYLSEKHIISLAARLGLKALYAGCPVRGKTRRADMDSLLKLFTGINPKAKDMMLTALKNTGTYFLWDKVKPEGK